MPIVPDTKDWTWVLERPCPECRFDASALDRTRVARQIRENAAAWRQVFDGADERGDAGLLRQRPSHDRWSAVEYACHVRDVFRLYDHRLSLMLSEDDPTYPNWDQDETAVAEHYGLQNPVVVLSDLVAAAETLAQSFDAVDGAQWSRPGRRSDGARFTVESFARYLVHDPVHHLHDVRQGLARLRARSA
jgi:hypothetical protein